VRPHPKGRGAAFNPPNRYERLHLEPLEEELPPDRQVNTEFFVDSSRSILAHNDSPDIPFRYSLNPYRGCEHGCIYCYARPSHEYLGFSAGTDFESRILVKPDAPALLEQAFRRKSWKPQVVALSGNTDPYQPVERRLELTRKCLAVFLRFRNPVSLITKNHLITRDIDILRQLAERDLVFVHLSITTLDPELARVMEPRTSTPALRLDALKRLAEAGIPTGVNVSPLIPGLTDQEMPAILREAAAGGARTACYIIVRLPGAVEPLFMEWLNRELPHHASKIRNRLRGVRGGEMTDSRFGSRMRGEGKIAESIRDLFHLTLRRLQLEDRMIELRTSDFTRHSPSQPALF
jgi:DNA repair photolyase